MSKQALQTQSHKEQTCLIFFSVMSNFVSANEHHKQHFQEGWSHKKIPPLLVMSEIKFDLTNPRCSMPDIKRPGSGCSKLTMSLVNVSLNFQ